jgi:hypothetical protein
MFELAVKHFIINKSAPCADATQQCNWIMYYVTGDIMC